MTPKSAIKCHAPSLCADMSLVEQGSRPGPCHIRYTCIHTHTHTRPPNHQSVARFSPPSLTATSSTKKYHVDGLQLPCTSVMWQLFLAALHTFRTMKLIARVFQDLFWNNLSASVHTGEHDNELLRFTSEFRYASLRQPAVAIFYTTIPILDPYTPV